MLGHLDMALAETRPAVGAMAGVRCLVLGAGGFLGGALCAALRAEGAAVHAYGRRLPAALRVEPGLRTEAAFEDAAALAAALRERAVLVRHFRAPRIAQYLRISIGTRDECSALVAALADILQ